METTNDIQSVDKELSRIAQALSARETDISYVIIPYSHQQLHDEVLLIEDQLLKHPAGEVVRDLLVQPQDYFGSSFHGLFHGYEQFLGGLSMRKASLAVISVNRDLYSDYRDMLFDVYRLTWFAMHSASLYKYAWRGQLVEIKNIFQPDYCPFVTSRNNLRADCFAISMLALSGHEDYCADKILNLISGALRSGARRREEEFPLIFAKGLIEIGIDKARAKSEKSLLSKITECYTLANGIGLLITDDDLRQWWSFAEKVQDLAWRGYTPEHILNTAAFHADDPYIRSMAFRMAGALQKKLDNVTIEPQAYNPFDSRLNSEYEYAVMISEIFDHILEKVVQEGDYSIFYQIAAEQNTRLLEGDSYGWCAEALQAAGDAYVQALAQGHSPPRAARLEFEVSRQRLSVAALQKLSVIITEARRSHIMLSWDQLISFCATSSDLDAFSKSIRQTVKYLNDLADANGTKRIKLSPEKRLADGGSFQDSLIASLSLAQMLAGTRAANPVALAI